MLLKYQSPHCTLYSDDCRRMNAWKYMTGNLENIGYARPGTECIYNIDIMEETCSILAFGAGAISKRVFPSAQTRIERAPCVKDIPGYIARVEEMAERKKKLFCEPV